jgi:hypothetical protein
MYSNVLGIVSIRQKSNEYLYDTFCDVSSVCDDIIVLDENKILETSEKKMLRDCFDAEIRNVSVSEVNYYEFSPEWVFACYNDERPSRRFRYMTVSLFLNPFINQWEAKLRFLWDNIDQYRVDYPWNEYEIPLAYKFIDEINYEWDKGLIPCNQPGPSENCMLDLYSYRYLKSELRMRVYKQFLREWNKYNFIERKHFEGLVAPEIMVEQAVE